MGICCSPIYGNKILEETIGIQLSKADLVVKAHFWATGEFFWQIRA
jgi:hypothetical protein